MDDKKKAESIDMRIIPIVVGIIGHRDIRDGDKEQLKEAVSIIERK